MASLHEVPSDAVDKAVTALQTAQDEAAKYVKEKQVKVDTSTLQSVLRDSLQEGIDTATLNLDSVAEQIAQGIDVPDDVWQEILDEYNALREAIGENPICINFETGEAKESKEKVDHLCKVKEEKEPVDNYLQMLESLKAKYL